MTTHVRVSEETWKRLNSRKTPGDDFDDVIDRLIELDDAAETLTEEWRLAADDDKGAQLSGREAYREAAEELEHNLPEVNND